MARQREFVAAWCGNCLRPLLPALWISTCLSGTASAFIAPKSVSQSLTSRPPPGFEVLLQPQLTVVDIVFGNRKLGTTAAVYTPDSLQFKDPGKVVDLISELADPKSVLSVLSRPLSPHSELVCAAGLPANCGQLAPAVVGIIFDETRFQVEVFINPIYLKAAKVGEARYLPTPSSHLALVDSLGGAISGSTQESPTYNLQNRAIVGYGSGRLSSDFSFSSGLGPQLETLAASVDQPGMRYQAGLFWTPDLDFFGQRRIVGLGLASQLDTRSDRDQISGTPLTVYLVHRAQVELYRDGRLLSSQFYDAGNQILNTSSLPEGAYALTLRIREPGGTSREEGRFFIKSRALPPPKEFSYFLDVGIAADDHPSAAHPRPDRPFFAAGLANRVSREWVVDAATVARGRSVQAEVGTTYFDDFAHFRFAAIASSNADFGLLLDAALQAPPYSLNVEVRKSWGPSPPPIAIPSLGNNSFDPIDTTPSLLAGNALQLVGSLTSVVGTAQIGLAGSFSSFPSAPNSFSFGPTVNWQFWNSDTVALTLVANAAQSNGSAQAYLGLRVQFTGVEGSVFGEGGAETLRDAGRVARNGATASLTGVLVEPNDRSGDLTATAGIVRTLQRSTTLLGGQLNGPYGNYYAEIDHDLAGQNRETRYSANFVTGGEATTDDVAFGGKNTSACGVIVQIGGHAANLSAEVVINGAPSGRLSAGRSLPIFLSPYATYSIRLVPLSASSAEFDTSERQVTLYPGNVETLTWDIEPIVDVFGRAMDINGRPIANARIEGAKGPGATDSEGYFQVELSSATTLVMRSAEGSSCTLRVDPISPANGYLALGTQTCRVPQ